jgi:hypothetical protein
VRAADLLPKRDVDDEDARLRDVGERCARPLERRLDVAKRLTRL